MKTLFVGLLIFELSLSGSQCCSVSASQREVGQVPNGFSYPESPSTTRVETPMIARSLSGTVLAPHGSKIAKVLVELVSKDWKKRIDAVFTDSKGSFSFAKTPRRKHFLKLSMAGFDTLLVMVITSKKSKAKLELYLKPSA